MPGLTDSTAQEPARRFHEPAVLAFAVLGSEARGDAGHDSPWARVYRTAVCVADDGEVPDLPEHAQATLRRCILTAEMLGPAATTDDRPVIEHAAARRQESVGYR